MVHYCYSSILSWCSHQDFFASRVRSDYDLDLHGNGGDTEQEQREGYGALPLRVPEACGGWRWHILPCSLLAWETKRMVVPLANTGNIREADCNRKEGSSVERAKGW